MKKIMFNDAYGLTLATIEERKTNTRRNEFDDQEQAQLDSHAKVGYWPFIENDTVKVCDLDGALLFSKPTRYKVGEVVAVAQRYADIEELAMLQRTFGHESYFEEEDIADEPGWRNKMFVKAEMMPHRIRITDIRAERLQDISDEDCIKEGIRKFVPNFLADFPIHPSHYVVGDILRDTPCNAFAALIDKVSGRGTWASNPWVVAYEYELVK